MKRIGCLIAALSLLMTLSACHTGGEAEQTLRIGVALYQQEDTFIETVTRELQRVALEKEQAQNCKINLYITDGKESQTSQNEQVDRFLERGYDVICVNIVDRTAAAVIIDKAQAAFEACGVKFSVAPIRGGTDGARLSYMGLLCPNLSTGGYNCHGRKELVSVQGMETMVDVLTEIVKRA